MIAPRVSELERHRYFEYIEPKFGKEANKIDSSCTHSAPSTYKMAPHALDVVFLALSPRLYTLRALIICSLLIITVNIKWMLEWPVTPMKPGLWIALYAFIAVHQIIR